MLNIKVTLSLKIKSGYYLLKTLNHNKNKNTNQL